MKIPTIFFLSVLCIWSCKETPSETVQLPVEIEYLTTPEIANNFKFRLKNTNGVIQKNDLFVIRDNTGHTYYPVIDSIKDDTYFSYLPYNNNLDSILNVRWDTVSYTYKTVFGFKLNYQKKNWDGGIINLNSNHSETEYRIRPAYASDMISNHIPYYDWYRIESMQVSGTDTLSISIKLRLTFAIEDYVIWHDLKIAMKPSPHVIFLHQKNLDFTTIRENTLESAVVRLYHNESEKIIQGVIYADKEWNDQFIDRIYFSIKR